MSTDPELFPTSTELKRCVVRAFRKRNPAELNKEDMQKLLGTIPEQVIQLCHSIRDSLPLGEHFFLTTKEGVLEPLILKNFVRFRIHCLKEDEELFSQEMVTALRTYAMRSKDEQTALIQTSLVIIDSRVAVLSRREKPTTLIKEPNNRKRAKVITFDFVKKVNK